MARDPGTCDPPPRGTATDDASARRARRRERGRQRDRAAPRVARLRRLRGALPRGRDRGDPHRRGRAPRSPLRGAQRAAQGGEELHGPPGPRHEDARVARLPRREPRRDRLRARRLRPLGRRSLAAAHGGPAPPRPSARSVAARRGALRGRAGGGDGQQRRDRAPRRRRQGHAGHHGQGVRGGLAGRGRAPRRGHGARRAARRRALLPRLRPDAPRRALGPARRARDHERPVRPLPPGPLADAGRLLRRPRPRVDGRAHGEHPPRRRRTRDHQRPRRRRDARAAVLPRPRRPHERRRRADRQRGRRRRRDRLRAPRLPEGMRGPRPEAPPLVPAAAAALWRRRVLVAVAVGVALGMAVCGASVAVFVARAAEVARSDASSH